MNQEFQTKRNLWDKISEYLWPEIQAEVDNERIEKIREEAKIEGAKDLEEKLGKRK